MSAKTILLAIADPQALADISDTLGAGWMPTVVRNEPDAVAQLKKFSFNAFLVDFNLGSPDASGLLDLALEEHPETVRFLLAYEADLALIAAKVNGPHHLLPNPLDLASLKNRIEEAVAEQNPSGDEQGNDAVAGQRASAKIPPVYAEVLKALEAAEVTSEQVGEIIARDEALTADVLRLASSCYLGSPRNLIVPAEAVELLGMGAVKTLVMALRYLAEHSHLRPGYLSFDELWEHSTRVAQIARDLVLFETKNRAMAEEAFAAGLVHDFGKVVLVTNFDDLYGRVHSLARNQPVALWDVEREMFGATHGEIGGCLVGMWNLPGPVVEATALHHEPPAGEQAPFTTLAAIHIANILAHELWPRDEFKVAPALDTSFLSGLGLLQRLPVWRAAFRNRSLDSLELEPEPVEHEPIRVNAPPASSTSAPQTTDQPAEQVAATLTATTPQLECRRGGRRLPASRSSERRWVYVGVAATLVMLTIWLASRAGFDASEPVEARAFNPVPSAVTPATVPGPVSVTSQSTEPELFNRAEASTEEAPAAAQPASGSPGPEPVPAIASPGTVTNVPPGANPSAATTSAAPPSANPTKKAPEFRVNGIFYTVSNPMAIINGLTVRVGDKVEGATVIRIAPNKVTLRIDDQTKTLSLE